MAPITQAPGLNITWGYLRTPAVNGAPIKLIVGERSLSVAIVPGTQHFVLGADFSLHLLDQFGVVSAFDEDPAGQCDPGFRPYCH